MKTKTTFFLLFVCFLSVLGQKKKIQATKAAQPAPAGFAKQLIGKDLDEATLFIDEKLSPKGFSFSKITDDKDFVYDRDFKKTDSAYQFYKNITANLKDAVFNIQLTADRNHKVNELQIFYDKNTEENFLNEMGINTWEVAEKKGTRTVFKTKELCAVNNNGELNVFIPEKLDVSALSEENNSMHQAIKKANKILTDAGNSLLSAKKRHVFNDHLYNFISYSTLLYYKNGFSVQINENAAKTTIIIDNDNQIPMNALLSKLQMNGFQEKYKGAVSNYTYYQKDSEMIRGTNTYLYLYTTGSDDDTRLKLQDTIDPAVLNDIYADFPDRDLRNSYIKDHFVFGLYDNGNPYIFGVDDKGNKVKCTLFDQKDFNDNWGVKFAIDYQNSESRSQSNYNLLADTIETVFWNLKDEKSYPSRIQFYDKTIYAANKASQDMQDHAKQLAQQQKEAERKQLEIEENERKAKRNAELTQGLQQITDQLLKLKKN